MKNIMKITITVAIVVFLVYRLSMIANIRAEDPNRISNAAPAVDVHFLKSGAFSNSQPAAPPRNNIGDIVVPIPKRIAIKVRFTRIWVIEYNKRARRAGHNTKPFVKPIENAFTSNLFFKPL